MRRAGCTAARPTARTCPRSRSSCAATSPNYAGKLDRGGDPRRLPARQQRPLRHQPRLPRQHRALAARARPARPALRAAGPSRRGCRGSRDPRSPPLLESRHEHRRPSHRLRPRRPRRGALRRRRHPPVHALVGRGDGVAGPRGERDDRGHRRCRRAARRAHGAAEGLRRARLRVLHELPEPQGTRTRRQRAGLPALLLAGARTPGPHRRRRGARERAGVGRVLPQPTAREPHRRVGVAAERGHQRQGLAARARGRDGPAARRRSLASAALGRLPGGPVGHRVLAGAAVPAARPPAATRGPPRAGTARASRPRAGRAESGRFLEADQGGCGLPRDRCCDYHSAMRRTGVCE